FFQADGGIRDIHVTGVQTCALPISVDLLVPEPVAAATEYAGRHPRAHGAVAVYDLGGGTFDAALVEVAPAGARLVGRPDGVERLDRKSGVQGKAADAHAASRPACTT